MFIVAWEGGPPPGNKAEWILVLREVLAAELGSYRVVFRRHPGGWRFSLEWREGEATGDALVANSPESVSYNLRVSLIAAGLPLDPAWRVEPGTRA